MKLKVIYTIMSISIIANLVLFDTLGKTVAENKLLKDTVLVQADTGIAMLKELITYKQSSRLINDVVK